jgi:uncharacterized protein YjaZ
MTQSPHNIHITILNASGRFNAVVDAIRAQTNKAIELLQTKIQLSDVDIIFSYNPVETIPHLGFGGYTPDAHTVQISVDTDNVELVRTIDDELVHTLLHEFHHAMRWRSVGYGETLGEALVTEGLADHFDVEVTGGAPQKWATEVSITEDSELLARARRLFSEPYSHEDWFFGSEAERLPKWAGYSLGWFLVKKYLDAHPGKHASQLHATPAAEILMT